MQNEELLCALTCGGEAGAVVEDVSKGAVFEMFVSGLEVMYNFLIIGNS